MQQDITLGKLAERCLRILNAGKDTTEQRVKQQDCVLAVAQARDYVLYEFISSRKAIDEHDFPFDILTEVEVTAVKKPQFHLATLPARGLSLFSHNSGIFAVYPSNDVSDEIIPTTNNFLRMYKRQPAREMEGQAFYVPFGQELKIYGFGGGENCNIIVQYVKAGEYFTEDEPFKIPPELQDAVVTKAMTILQNQLGQEDPLADAKNI